MVETFLDHLKFEKRYSAHTLTAYRSDLLQFQGFLGDTFNTASVEFASTQQVRSFMTVLMDEGNTPATVQRKLITLRSFYKFLMGEGVLKKNPLAGVKAPKSSSRLPAFIEEKDIDKLGAVPSSFDFTSVRNELVVQMLYQTGMRRSELIHLRSLDIDLEKLELKVLGKRNKERLIPFTQNLKGMIQRYLLVKKGLKGANHEVFVVLDNGKPVYDKFIYKVVTDTLGTVTTSEKKGPHVLRHSYATHLLNNGANISSIKELLGHSSLASTQVYTHNNIEQMKKVHASAHPRA
jgi:integrase/recombinase XerC